MSGIRINNKDIYKIEVNDNGDCIEFDLNDIGLKVKLYNTLETLEKLEKKYKEQMENVEGIKKQLELETEMFSEMRKAMDGFLGKNACQKIFGDRNYYEMYYDLFEELAKKRPELEGKSYFDMLNLKSENIRNRIEKKYGDIERNVI